MQLSQGVGSVPVFVPAEPHAYALLRKHMDQLGSFGDANSA